MLLWRLVLLFNVPGAAFPVVIILLEQVTSNSLPSGRFFGSGKGSCTRCCRSTNSQEGVQATAAQIEYLEQVEAQLQMLQPGEPGAIDVLRNMQVHRLLCSCPLVLLCNPPTFSHGSPCTGRAGVWWADAGAASGCAGTS